MDTKRTFYTFLGNSKEQLVLNWVNVITQIAAHLYVFVSVNLKITSLK